MKKLIIIAVMGLALGVSVQTQAQVTTNTAPAVLDLLNHTNIFCAAGMSYDLTEHQVGGVVGVGYQLELPVVEDMLFAEARMDYSGEAAYLIEGTVTIKPPRKIAGKWPVCPVAELGIATAFSGAGEDNGKAIPIVGTGITARLYKRFGLIIGYEWWVYPDKTHERVVACGWLNF